MKTVLIISIILFLKKEQTFAIAKSFCALYMANGAKDTFSSSKGILTGVKEAYGSEMCLIHKKGRLVVELGLC